MTYLITFTGYGCRLHGDEAGSVDRIHNLYRSRLIEPDAERVRIEQALMDQPPYCMDGKLRDAVLASLIERCLARGWDLLAAHVRRNHVHIVLTAEVRPERVMNDLKSYASQVLNQLELDAPGRKRWARHGSTRWLWKPDDVSAAIQYVIERQGEPMAMFIKG